MNSLSAVSSSSTARRRALVSVAAFVALSALYGCAADSGGSDGSGTSGSGGAAGSTGAAGSGTGGSATTSGTASDCAPGCAALYKCGTCLSDASGACVDEATCRSQCEQTTAYYAPAACVAKAASCDAANACVGATSGGGSSSQTSAGKGSGEPCSISAQCMSGLICCSAHQTCQTGSACLQQINAGLAGVGRGRRPPGAPGRHVDRWPARERAHTRLTG